MAQPPMTEPMDPPFDTVPPPLWKANWQARRVLRLRPRPRPMVFRVDSFDPNDMLDTFARTAERFLALLRSLPPESGQLPVPGLTWTVAETAAHQYTVLRRGRDPRRGQTLDELGRLNQICVDEVPSRDLRHLADLLEREISYTSILRRSLPTLWRLRVGRWLTLKLHFGFEADIPVVLTYPTTDMLLHGWEIAKATNTDWDIPAPDAAVALMAGLPQTFAWIPTEILDGPIRSHRFTFGHGHQTVTITVGDGRYDVSFEPRGGDAPMVDPVAWMLHVFGRTGPTGDPITDDVASWTLPI